ncbi:hypothetical protein [Flavivirga jejuensis]|uniref:LTXXQ motif family protein n=1 Tax=Flavivirga jejuensis TaxID=870487 RepID=A0ABT8WKX8_9FLAO|nr:hypothetical protein [Flavivirga jejuensis]MDO5973806.1 hypothetical protein [Flavivirga jejuensis]
MKKSALTVIVGLLISVSALAQSKSEMKIEKRATKAVEKLETTIKLSESEKATYFELQKAKLQDRANFPKGLKESDPDAFKAKAKANRKEFTKSVIKAFGEKRGKEILEAAKKKKK